MPEIRFVIRWPDGEEVTCYSPSLVIRDYFAPSTAYPLTDFLDRSRTALGIASERVRAKYGVPCSRALRQLGDIETRAAHFADQPAAQVICTAFIE
ncbi:MSMEG_0570 family nitrogen starvation response protein [Labrys monachus]|uniref:Repeat protein (TIGR04042 family) n=1 Tax=Labrys monachus TaxID=217067 RepID=A0ABU0FC22_9HYPH|nr:MSMEG_0570 family nitrogen starvation response protein [Labrys monachus]MDQ0392091.1 putative repeat protein (TIGR04042 family) [Labrys monachus]